MYIIGIDPGITGAIALLYKTATMRRARFIALEDLPTVARGAGGASVRNEINPIALENIVARWRKQHNINSTLDAMVVLEYLASRPLMASGTVFSMGDTFGTVRAVLALQRWGMHFVTPATWKKGLGLAQAKQTTKEKKERSRAMAVHLYPNAPLDRVKDHNRAEALLIAHYGATALF